MVTKKKRLNLAFLQKNTDTQNMNNTVSALSAVADATAFSSAEKQELVAHLHVPLTLKLQEMFETPELQFVDEVVDGPVAMLKQIPTIQTVPKIVDVSPAQYIHQLVYVAVAMQRPVRTTQTVHETGETPQSQYMDRIVDVPVVKKRQVRAIQTEQKTLEVPHSLYSRSSGTPAGAKDGRGAAHGQEWSMFPSRCRDGFPPWRCHRFSTGTSSLICPS